MSDKFEIQNFNFEIDQWEVPVDVDECLDLIDKGMSALVKVNTLIHWHIGRIITTLQSRKSDACDNIAKGEGNELDEEYADLPIYRRVQEKTGYGRTTLDYGRRFFQAFEFEDAVALCEKGVKWAVVKDLARIVDPNKRDAMIQKLKAGDINREEIADILYDYLNDTDDPDTMEGEADNLGLPETASDTSENSAEEDTTQDPSREVSDTEKYFFELNQDMVRFSETVDEALVSLPDHLEARDNDELHNDEEWQQIVKITDHIQDHCRELGNRLSTVSKQIQKADAQWED